jgi:hypothetical protein
MRPADAAGRAVVRSRALIVRDLFGILGKINARQGDDLVVSKPSRENSRKGLCDRNQIVCRGMARDNANRNPISVIEDSAMECLPTSPAALLRRSTMLPAWLAHLVAWAKWRLFR